MPSPATLACRAETDGIERLTPAAIISDQEGRVLLLRRVPGDYLGGWWDLPGGHADPGEGILPALYREVREETGLVVERVVRYVGSFDYVSGSGRRTRQHTIAVAVWPVEIMLNLAEHDAHRWAAADDEWGVTPEMATQLRLHFQAAKER